MAASPLAEGQVWMTAALEVAEGQVWMTAASEVWTMAAEHWVWTGLFRRISFCEVFPHWQSELSINPGIVEMFCILFEAIIVWHLLFHRHPCYSHKIDWHEDNCSTLLDEVPEVCVFLVVFCKPQLISLTLQTLRKVKVAPT